MKIFILSSYLFYVIVSLGISKGKYFYILKLCSILKPNFNFLNKKKDCDFLKYLVLISFIFPVYTIHPKLVSQFSIGRFKKKKKSYVSGMYL